MVIQVHGKKMVVSEYTLKFGNKDRYLNVFGCVKYKTNGNQYIIYSDSINTGKDALYYGMVHMNPDKLVVMECKDGELIKELVWKLVNKKDLEDFTFLDIGDRTKVELISCSSYEVKPKILKELEELTMEKPKEVKREEKQKSGCGGFIVLIILMLIGCGGYYFYLNQDKFLGYGSEIVCNTSYDHEKLKNVLVREKIILKYDRYDKYEGVTINTSYIFEDYEEYKEFKSTGEYFKYQPDNYNESNGDGYKLEDATKTYRTIVNKGVNGDYFEETDYDKAISFYQEKGYTCELKEKTG